MATGRQLGTSLHSDTARMISVNADNAHC
jgi:hypothetical protein